MSKTTQCDVCKKCEPEVEIERQRRQNWWLDAWSPEGKESTKLDLCDECWKSWEAFVANRVTYK